MKKMKYLILFILSLSFVFIGCDKSTEPEEKPEEAFEKSVAQMDVTMATMLSSQMFMAFVQMPDSLIDLPSIPLKALSGKHNSLNKNIIKRDFASADSTILDMFSGLERLYGTHIYDGTKWNHSNTPANEVIIQYPFMDINTNTSRQMYVRIYGVVKSEILLQISMEAKIDNVRKFYLEYAKVVGTGLLSPQPNPVSIVVKGDMTDDNNKKTTYQFDMTNSQISFALTPSGLETMTFTIVGSGFFTMDTELTSNVTSVSLQQGKMKIEITEFEATNGDIGDVYYANKKIADIWLVDEMPYIYYTNGKQVALNQLMPVFGQFMGGM